jgi:hypothetical protein
LARTFAFDVGERILRNQFVTYRRAKEQLRELAAFAYCVFAQAFMRRQPQTPLVGVARCNVAQRLVRAKPINEVAANVAPNQRRRRLHRTASAVDVAVDERRERRATTGGRQSCRSQPIVQLVG